MQIIIINMSEEYDDEECAKYEDELFKKNPNWEIDMLKEKLITSTNDKFIKYANIRINSNEEMSKLIELLSTKDNINEEQRKIYCEKILQIGEDIAKAIKERYS